MNNGKICVSVCAEKASEFIEKIERAAKIADIIELRFDCLEENGFENVLAKIEGLMKSIKNPFLATCRPQNKDAHFLFGKGVYKSKAQLDRAVSEQNKRISKWKKIFCASNFAFIDFEEDLMFELLSSDPLSLFDESEIRDLKKSKVLYSEHFFDVTNLRIRFKGIYRNLTNEKLQHNEIKSRTAKIAVQANDVTDGLELIKLLAQAKSENKELIPIAMGEHGIWTRILGLSRGAFMTFASLDDESATAPGQLTAEEMINVYRVKELDENTEIYGLVAGATAHSVSPQMHNAAFKFHNLNAVYVPFAVKNLEEFIHRMVNPKTQEIDWKLRGLSVTIPHKIEIIKYLDFVDETARQIGAVNTVKIVGDELHGFNTDAAGFIEPLKNAYGDLKNAKVAVFGAGGAARAVVYALKNDGAEITVFARDLAKAEDLKNDFGVEIKLINDYQSPTVNYNIMINTTPLGMKKGGMENDTPLTAEQLEGVKLVYDLVYNPFETRLIKEAQSVFVPTIGGLAMLVAQAIEQQKIWTGLDAPVKEMNQAALKKLSREN